MKDIEEIIQPGMVINDVYRIDHHVDSGGMGAVFRAWHVELHRAVALKFLLPFVESEEENIRRFKRECKIMTELKHRNLVTVYQFGLWQEKHPFMAMELLEGQSLENRIRSRGPLTVSEGLDMALQVCDGLSAIHSEGIAHRDLKPENVFFQAVGNETVVKIIDFGLANFMSPARRLKITQTGTLLGSIYYISPEACLRKRTDHRADIYALGCVLYEALTARPPLSAENPLDLIDKHISDYPLPLAKLMDPEFLPPGLEKVLFKAMSKQPDERHASAQELRHDLAAVRAGRGDSLDIDLVGPLHPGYKPGRRRGPGLPVLIGVMLVCAALFFLSTDQGILLLTNLMFPADDTSQLSEAEGIADWLGRIGRTRAKILVLTERTRVLPPSVEKAQLYFQLSRTYKKTHQPIERRSMLSLCMQTLASLPSDELKSEKFKKGILKSLIDDCEEAAHRVAGYPRWAYDRDLQMAVQQLRIRYTGLQDLDTAIDLCQVTLLDAGNMFECVLSERLALVDLERQRGDLAAAAVDVEAIISDLKRVDRFESPFGISAMLNLAAIQLAQGQTKKSYETLSTAVKRLSVQLEYCSAKTNNSSVLGEITVMAAVNLSLHKKYEEAAVIAGNSLRLLDLARLQNERIIYQLVEQRVYALVELKQFAQAKQALEILSRSDRESKSKTQEGRKKYLEDYIQIKQSGKSAKT